MTSETLLITGSPGVGKTTLLMKIVRIVKGKGYSVGGMISREVRENGVRVGFEILDLTSGKHGWLANMNQKVGPQVGKYRVNLVDLENIGAQAIIYAVENSDVVAIDEIGPMELFSEKFKNATRKAMESTKPVMAVVHWKAQDKLINDAKNMKGSETYTVTPENRDELSNIIADETIRALERD
jgi:nucleoside-triphosphatase